MDFKYVIKKDDNWYIVKVDLNNINSGYGVIPRKEDPQCAYDIEDVKAYCEAHPDKVLTKHPLEDSYIEKMRLESDIRDKEQQLAGVNEEIFEIISQDFLSELTGSVTLDLNQEDIIAVFDRKSTLLINIEELKAQLEALEAK